MRLRCLAIELLAFNDLDPFNYNPNTYMSMIITKKDNYRMDCLKIDNYSRTVGKSLFTAEQSDS